MKTKVQMVAAVVALGVAACGGGAKDSKPPAEPVASKTMPVAEAPPVDEPTGFAECDAYVAEVRYFDRCDAFPRATRDAEVQTVAAAKPAWKGLQDPGAPEEALVAVRDACARSNLELHQAIQGAGGCKGIGAEPPLPAAVLAPPPHATTVATGIAECDRYLAAARRLIACERMPAEARRAQQQALDAAEPGWKSLADPQVPADAKQAATDACHEAADSIEQTMAQLQCPPAAP